MSVNGISFKSNYFIPYNQINDSDKMRKFGYDSAEYLNNAAQVKDGLVLSVDDNKDKEYEAVIAKYGLSIQKYKGKVDSNQDMTMESYSFLVKKVHPDKADEMIAKYSKMDDKAKGAAYLEAYRDFKNSPHSIERQQKLAHPKIKPTGSPIIRFEAKNGEKFMAREVALESGYTCFAVSNVKMPDQAMLMNKDDFKLLMADVKKLS